MSIVLIILICIGIGLVLFGVFKKDNAESKADYLELGVSTQLLKKNIDDADNAIEQLNALSKNVFEEFEGKYQELLFLYQMIDEMKNSISNVNYLPDNNYRHYNSGNVKAESYSNPKFEKIINMQKQGLNISEISKALNMGQGEVKLILELGKAR